MVKLYLRMVRLHNGNRRDRNPIERPTKQIHRTQDNRQSSFHLRPGIVRRLHSSDQRTIYPTPRDFQQRPHPSDRISLRPNVLPQHRQHLRLHPSLRRPVLRPLAHRCPASSILDLPSLRFYSRRRPIHLPLHRTTKPTHSPIHDASLDLAHFPCNASRNLR